ncbi:MAG: DUF2620 domain-containing protein [Spiroplasma sp.]|nr:DUF2620 domain-containing protein [Mycoplasmatales bacterium]
MNVVVGGQMDKREVLAIVEKLKRPEDTVVVKSDLDATLMIQAREADIYVGACNTGGGGALAMAISILGIQNCVSISMPGNIMSNEQIKKEVSAGKVAFGFVASDKEKVLPVLFKFLQNK